MTPPESNNTPVERKRQGSQISQSDTLTREFARELARDIGQWLKARGHTLAVAESCSGGFLAHCLTNIPGASDYFIGGIVSYANRVKVDWLGVEQATLDRVGAVSEAVAAQMAQGVRARLGTTYALSITGIAGPSGGTAAKPVGTVYMGIAAPTGVRIQKGFFPGDRLAFKEAVIVAILQAFKEILSEP